MRFSPRLSASVLLATLVACASNPQTDSAEPKKAEQKREAVLSVENRSSLDMDIFLRGNALPSRIGFAPANQTTKFQLTPAMTAGSGFLRIEARPTVRAGRTVVSEPLSVRMGEEITFSIPPQ